jgi:stage V sporulation protein SpoVS
MTQSVGRADDIVLKVSSSKEPGYVKRVAGAMGWQLREHGLLKARAVKAIAVNTAVKAIAICNQRVNAAGITLCVDLLFDKAEKEATVVEMTVRETDAPKPAVFMEYRVSGKPDDNATAKLAEALAAPAREGKGVSMRCIGAAAVYRAILASTMARGLVFPNGMDAVVVPSWMSLPQTDAAPISLLNIDFWGVQKQPSS